jgi:hypothetical protein
VLAVLGPEKSMVSQQIPRQVAGENLTGDRVARIVLQAATIKAVMDESSYICIMPAPDEPGKSLLPTSSILLPSYTPLRTFYSVLNGYSKRRGTVIGCQYLLFQSPMLRRCEVVSHLFYSARL